MLFKMNDDNHNITFLDLLIMWVGTVVGHITLSTMVLLATLVYTLIKTYLLIRDNFWRKPDEPK